MDFALRMGVPEMLQLWTDLQTKYRNGTKCGLVPAERGCHHSPTYFR